MCTVLYQDEKICAIFKPPGVFVHPSALDRNVPDCRTRLEKRLGRSVYNVHRIDRPASGVVLCALDRQAAAHLAEQFRNRTAKKQYLAIVRGHVSGPLTIDTPISDPRRGTVLPATTHVKTLAQSIVNEPVGIYSEGWFSLVLAEIDTGRPHQIRRHVRKAGHPIIGDTEYGDGAQNRYFYQTMGFRRLCLLAYYLQVTHPETARKIAFCSGIPAWWRRSLNALNLALPPELETEMAVSQKSL